MSRAQKFGGNADLTSAICRSVALFSGFAGFSVSMYSNSFVAKAGFIKGMFGHSLVGAGATIGSAAFFLAVPVSLGIAGRIVIRVFRADTVHRKDHSDTASPDIDGASVDAVSGEDTGHRNDHADTASPGIDGASVDAVSGEDTVHRGDFTQVLIKVMCLAGVWGGIVGYQTSSDMLNNGVQKSFKNAAIEKNVPAIQRPFRVEKKNGNLVAIPAPHND